MTLISVLLTAAILIVGVVALFNPFGPRQTIIVTQSTAERESFSVYAYQAQYSSAVLTFNNGSCSISSYSSPVEDYVVGTMDFINVAVVNTGSVPLVLTSVTVNSNVTGGASAVYSGFASVPTGWVQTFHFPLNTANFPTSAVARLQFTFMDTNKVTNSTDLWLKPITTTGAITNALNSTTTSTTTSTTSLSTGISCPVTVGVSP